jgi:histidyl-tRNA synthetase
MLGVNSPEADAELIAIAATFLKLSGLTPQLATIFVNNRRLMDTQFTILGIPVEKRIDVSNAVDRRGKMDTEKWDEYVLAIGIDQSQLNGLKQILADYKLWQKSDELVRLFKALDALGVSAYVKFDPSIMRGLLYYTGTVFEAFDVSGSVRRAILGGGRYDNLLRDVGGEPLSGVGFAMGDVVLGIILQEKGLIPAFIPTPAPVLVTVFDESLWMSSYSLAADLRAVGLNVTVYPEPAKLPKQFKYGDRMGMQIIIVIGPDEELSGMVTVKDLKNGVQETVLRSEVGKLVCRILEIT